MSVSTRAPRRADRRHVVAHSHKARARGRDARPSAAARQLPVRRHVRHQLQRNYRPAGAAMCACASARAGVEARQYRQGSRGGAAPPATTLPKTTVRRTAMAEPLGVAAGEASPQTLRRLGWLRRLADVVQASNDLTAQRAAQLELLLPARA